MCFDLSKPCLIMRDHVFTKKNMYQHATLKIHSLSIPWFIIVLWNTAIIIHLLQTLIIHSLIDISTNEYVSYKDNNTQIMKIHTTCYISCKLLLTHNNMF